MKTFIAVIATIVHTATVSAQTTSVEYFADVSRNISTNAARAEQNYIACLNMDNQGVIESALAQVAMLRLLKISNGSEALRTRVAVLARTAASPELRYKAFLTRTVLEEPQLFETIATTGYESADDFFSVIASRMSEHYATR